MVKTHITHSRMKVSKSISGDNLFKCYKNPVSGLGI